MGKRAAKRAAPSESEVEAESPTDQPAPSSSPGVVTASCSTCEARVPLESLESHLRLELNYGAWRCGLCQLTFIALADALNHFRGRFSRHPGAELSVVELPSAAKEAELGRLVDAALRTADGPIPFGLAQTIMAPADLVPTDLPPFTLSKEKMSTDSEEFGRVSLAEASVLETYADDGQLQPLKSEPEDSPESPGKKDVKGAPFPTEEEPLIKGAVACSMCKAGVVKAKFESHVIMYHLSVQPFFCNLCPFKARRKDYIKKHLISQHSVAMTPENHSSIMGKLGGKVSGLVGQCFGDVSGIAAASALCRVCDEDVPRSGVSNHVALHHLKQKVFKCALCPFASSAWATGPIRAHVKADHRGAGPDAFHNLQAQYVTAMKSMTLELFGVPFRTKAN